MLRKDLLVRQFEEFGKFLGILYGLKGEYKWLELQELINTSSHKYTSVEIDYVEKLNNGNLIEELTQKKELKESQLKMLADLLYEKGISYTKLLKEEEGRNVFTKAQTIYTYIKNNSLEIDFSLDMHFKMKAIEQLLKN
jgi:hypothetical protein